MCVVFCMPSLSVTGKVRALENLMTALFIHNKKMCELQYLYSVIYEILMHTFLRSPGIFTRFNCIYSG